MLVDRLRSPLPSKSFVNIGFHWLIGIRRFVLPSNTNCSSAEPLIAVIVNVAPLTLMPVMTGCGITDEPTLIMPWLASNEVSQNILGEGSAGRFVAENVPLSA